MFTTIVTPVNFNRFAKRLKKNSHEYSLDISLSSAQDILSKTFGFKNQFELKKQFTNPDIHFVEINELKYQYFLYRFRSFFDCDVVKSKTIFDETFSLFKEREPSVKNIHNSIISIIKKITHIANNDELLQKIFIGHVKEKLCFMTKKYNTRSVMQSVEYNGSNEHKKAQYLAIEKANAYPNLKEFWGENLTYNVNHFPEESIYLDDYFSLLNELLSYKRVDIIDAFNKHKEIFMHANQVVYFIKFESEKLIFLNKEMYEKNYYVVHVDNTDKSLYAQNTFDQQYTVIPNEILKRSLNGEIVNKIIFNGNKNCLKYMNDFSLKELVSRANLIQNPDNFRIVEIFSEFSFIKQVTFEDAEHLLGKVYTIEEANSMIK
jgi:hypothetical protein